MVAAFRIECLVTMMESNGRTRGIGLQEEPGAHAWLLRIARGLMWLALFFSSWGTGFQFLDSLLPASSKMFVACGTASAILCAFETPRMRWRFPRALHLFVLYSACHCLVLAGFLFFHGELNFTYVGSTEYLGYINMIESSGLLIMRYIAFIAIAYGLATLMRTETQRIYSCLFYCAGFTVSLIQPGFTDDLNIEVSRRGGGFTDANVFGNSAVISAMLGTYILVNNKSRRWHQLAGFGFVSTGVYAIMESGSRGAIGGIIVGAAITAILLLRARKAQILVAIGAVSCVAGLLMVPQATVDMVVGRSSINEMTETRGSLRLDIWYGYLSNLDQFALLGTGLGRNTTAAVDTIADYYDTHNTFLNIWVEFGTPGLILFTIALWQLVRWLLAEGPKRRDSINRSVLVGLLVATMVCGFFVNMIGSRQLWIVLGVIGSYRFMTRQENIPANRRILV